MNSLKNIKGIAPHISYEIEMFEMYADKLRGGSLNQLEQNVYLEGFIIHARCLTDFIYPPIKMKKDDVVADHFFTNPEKFHSLRPNFEKLIEVIKMRTGKEVAHLTYKRLDVTSETKPWRFLEIQKELNTALAVFFNCLSEEQRSWFPSIVTTKNI